MVLNSLMKGFKINRTIVWYSKLCSKSNVEKLTILTAKYCKTFYFNMYKNQFISPELTEVLAPRVGLEPTTLRLTAACSAIELPRNLIQLKELQN